MLSLNKIKMTPTLRDSYLKRKKGSYLCLVSIEGEFRNFQMQISMGDKMIYGSIEMGEVNCIIDLKSVHKYRLIKGQAIELKDCVIFTDHCFMATVVLKFLESEPREVFGSIFKSNLRCSRIRSRSLTDLGH